MRSALLGAVVAVTVIVTSLTFASSLNALVSQPPLYGWNWNYALLAGFSAAENLPAAQTAALLDDDPDVAHWAPAYFESVDLNGQSVPALAMSPGAAVRPSMLSGHAPEEASQIVLGPSTLASLHKHLGDTVVAEADGHTKVHLRIVGTATLPTIGGSGDPSLQMGTGAVVATSLFSATDLNQQGAPVAGPMAAFITVHPGVSPGRRPALARPRRGGAQPVVGSRCTGRRGGQRTAPGRDRRHPQHQQDTQRCSPPSWPPGQSARSGSH